MTLQVRERRSNNGQYKAIVAWNKGNYYTLTVFEDRGQHTVESCDVLINNRVYPSEKAAVDAMNRAIRKINKQGYLY